MEIERQTTKLLAYFGIAMAMGALAVVFWDVLSTRFPKCFTDGCEEVEMDFYLFSSLLLAPTMLGFILFSAMVVGRMIIISHLGSRRGDGSLGHSKARCLVHFLPLDDEKNVIFSISIILKVSTLFLASLALRVLFPDLLSDLTFRYLHNFECGVAAVLLRIGASLVKGSFRWLFNVLAVMYYLVPVFDPISSYSKFNPGMVFWAAAFWASLVLYSRSAAVGK